MSKYLETGTVLKNRYQTEAVMGENPLGITYRAMDMETKNVVVIKEFFPSKLCERKEGTAQVEGGDEYEKEKERFFRESQLLQQKRGLEGIVEVLDVFEENKTSYAVMEYVEGVSLETYLAESGKQFPIKRMKDLTAPIVSSLMTLHNSGLIHQNISPDNLIFTNQGKLKLIGFGCVEGEVSSASIGYAPIELYRKQEISSGTDVYALCGTIYRCITGVRPQDAYERLNCDEIKKPSMLGVAMESTDEAALMMGLNVYEENRLRTMQAFQRAFYGEAEPVRPVQPIPLQPQPTPPVQGMGGAIIPPVTMKKKEIKKDKKEKKSGSGGMIALVIIGSILIIALGISAFILARQLFPSETKKADNKQEELLTEEETTEDETGEEEDASYSEYETMLADGKYAELIEELLSLDTAQLSAKDKDALSGIFELAISGQYSEFESRVSSSQNAGDYDGAFAALEEEILLYDRLGANDMSMMYIDKQKIESKKISVKNDYVDYLLNDRLNDAIALGDETVFNEIIDKLQALVDDGTMAQEEFERKNTEACVSFVIAKITEMNNAGTDAATIISYIDANLASTGNNCQVLEFWDYFNAVLGRNVMDARVKHVTASGYLLEYSNSVNLTNDNISHLSQYELILAIYEIFARHGRTFSDQSINRYFADCSWYQPTTGTFDESTLNTFEKYNLNLLIEYQKSMGYR